MHGIESLRQPYGFGSFVSKAFKKVGRGVKKVLKSPIGKAALLGLGAYYGPGLMGKAGWTGPQGVFAGGGKGSFMAKLFGTPAQQGVWTGVGSASGPGLGGKMISGSGAASTKGILSGALKFIGKNQLPLAIAGGAGLGTAAMAGKGEDEPSWAGDSGQGHEDYLKARKLWDWGGEEPMFSAAEGGRVHAQQGLLATPQYQQMMADPMTSGQGGTPNMPGLIRDEETTGRATQQTADAELIQLIKMLTSLGIPMEQLRGRSKQELVELMISVSGPRGEEQEMVQAAEGGRVGYNEGGSYKDWLSSKGYDDMMKGMSGDEIIKLYDSVKGTWSKAQGGRIGLRGGGDDSIFIDESMEVLRGGEDGDVELQENIEIASDPTASDSLNDLSMNEFGKPVHELTPEEYQILLDMANDSAEMPNQPQVMANQGGLMRTGYAMGTEHPVIPSKDGNQLDMRDSGGYQPHGAQEKKDDVRALLAQGEFVMTSDAVRGMGGGDREVGAKKMYNLMHNMEAMA